MADTNIFATIKQTISKEQFKDYIASNYGIEFKGNNSNAFCPFHSHDYKTPSLGVSSNSDGAFFHCFSCNTSGDLVKFVELKEGISATAAAKKVCDYFAIPCNVNEKELSDDELRAYQKRNAEIKKTNELRAKKEAAEFIKRQNALKARLKELAPTLNNDMLNNEGLLSDIFDDLFYFRDSSLFSVYANELLGYSFEHKSPVIIIKNENDEPINLKFRQKFKYDNNLKQFGADRMDGKWIGEANASAYPFPLRYFLANTDDRVVICEGEKDALNLLSLGVRVITLGGVTASFSKYPKLLEVLKDKEIYIWFDNDEAGYLNAIKRYYELKEIAKDTHIVMFYALRKFLPAKYDISDYLFENKESYLQEKDPANKLFNAISFSCFKPTNDVLDEICEWFSTLKDQLNPYRQRPVIKHFDEIIDEFLQTDKKGKYINIFPVKGELDDETINVLFDEARALKKGNKEYDKFKELYISTALFKERADEDFQKFSCAFDKVFEIKKSMLASYHQTHISDMVNSFSDSLIKLGYNLSQYKGELYFWTKTHYARLDKNTLSNFIQVEWMQKAYVDTKKVVVDNAQKIIDNLHNRAYILDNIKRDENRRIVNFKNGTAFVSKNGKFTFKPRHDKKDGALTILDFDYDAKATCPKWNRFLKQVLGDEDDIKTLMEFIGYCFLPSHAFESFLFLYGKSGANGKSVILDTIRAFFGDENVSSLQLQQFEGHQLYGLANKLINIGSEIDKNGTDKGQLANLKALVSTKDSIMINPKNKDPFNLMPNEKPKLAFAGNEKPKQGLDNGVFRRMILLTFDKEVRDGAKIHGLSERFKDELAGIFNLAIAGLQRLITQGKFTRSKRMLSELEEYKDEINPIRTFVREGIIKDGNYLIPNKYLYNVYKAFIETKGGRALAEKSFFKALRDECMMNNIVISYGQKRLNMVYAGLTNNRPNCAFGIRLSDDFDFESINISGVSIDVANLSIYQRDGAKADE
ncbi:phage/plasmid primase, P4 family [Campylobacter gastrosuis]|uniref:Phage/plasmid primase, P4 family n=1 Tax=Campylobacter gastrosuis TaxID=2974576 RepID=A0ABT7HPF5_9BACT|nr:phage/plasmid primase, P4 family [Campylobacter gastrosuis]MDL0088503.1 phage/plasmid primase, P4 family [Campylobacter gastrosuis]